MSEKETPKPTLLPLNADGYIFTATIPGTEEYPETVVKYRPMGVLAIKKHIAKMSTAKTQEEAVVEGFAKVKSQLVSIQSQGEEQVIDGVHDFVFNVIEKLVLREKIKDMVIKIEFEKELKN